MSAAERDNEIVGLVLMLGCLARIERSRRVYFRPRCHMCAPQALK